MSFFEDLGKKLNFAMGETVSKTKEIASVTKLNTSIAARQHEIEDAYREIGRALYAREVNDPDSPVASLCAKVAANLDSIADMKAQIAQLKSNTAENRIARSVAIFGTEPAPQPAETPEEAEAAAEPVADAVEAAAEAAADAVAPIADAAEQTAHDAAEAVADAAEIAADAAADAADETAQTPDDTL